ncbi:MAG TPA: HU family DNA-binding protein [Cyanobacteria bacterium UBA8156]|jgi:nucleoid DNA-binding protein|nr:HU family DNA-binding protein [Cyanobacteria bacterium UBA8156]
MADLNRYDLARAMAAEVDGLTHRMAAACLDAFVECVSRALTREESVILQNFGKFGVRRRKPRQGTHPQTQQAIAIAGAPIPFFTASPALKKRVRLAASQPESHGQP